MQENLINIYKDEFGDSPEIRIISGGGSSRKYYRLAAGSNTVIGVENEDKNENEVFLRLARYLESQKINVPHIIREAKDRKSYLLQDLGNISLLDILNSSDKIKMAQTALEKLVEIQTLSPADWEDKVGYPPFSERLVRWDLNYFKYDFLKPYGVPFDEEKLEDDFDKICDKLLDTTIINGLMYRDFQSRNIMYKDNTLWFIDFQGARKGPIAYDAISFIWQAKAPFTYEERESLGDFYAEKISDLGFSGNSVKEQLELIQVFRTLQVLGAYGFRGLIEKKPHFVESLPLGVKNLDYLREKGRLDNYPEIYNIAMHLKERLHSREIFEEDRLTLTVVSFSYKKGYPEDLSGNGGGFIFDCRALHNPGRYDEYRHLTGKDLPVKEFLLKEKEVALFIDNALAIVKPSIERYLKRGFTSLQVGFGCTGGQHRSVYCAELFAKQIKDLYPDVDVRIKHRENP